MWAIWGAKGIGLALLGVAVAAVAPLIAPQDLRTQAPEGMVWIRGAEFLMGSNGSVESLSGNPNVVKDSRPVHRVVVDGFWMDRTEMTNEQFEKFVKGTFYITVAERTPTREGNRPGFRCMEGTPVRVTRTEALHEGRRGLLKLSIPTADGVLGRFQPLLGRSQCGSTCSPS